MDSSKRRLAPRVSTLVVTATQRPRSGRMNDERSTIYHRIGDAPPRWKRTNTSARPSGGDLFLGLWLVRAYRSGKPALRSPSVSRARCAR